MTSEDEKTVHQQSISDGPFKPGSDAFYDQAGDREWLRSECKSLAAEVRRLQGSEFDVVNERNGLRKYYGTALADLECRTIERDRLREKYDLEQKTAFVLAQKLTAKGDELAAFEKVYETHTNQLRAKLRRVEASATKFEEVAIAYKEAGLAERAGALKAAADDIRRSLAD